MRYVVAAVLLAGCATRTTTANPSELATHARAFTHEGRAELVRPEGNVTVSAGERVDVRIDEGDGLQRPASLTVRELVDGCTSEGPESHCLARRVIDEPVLRHRERRFDSSRAATLVGLGAIGGLLGYCMAECQGDADIEKGAAYSVGIMGGMIALGVLLMIVGGD